MAFFVANYQTKADIFNEFFAKQCFLLPNDSSIPAFTPKCDKILSSVGIDRSKVLSLIRSLDSKKAYGCDDLSIAMLKICDLAIVEPLSLIYEKYLESGKYSSLWKKANVLPIHKKESRQLKKNCRPISMLLICGKLRSLYLMKYVSRDVRDQIYKPYVRPHVDYGDIIYHKHDPEFTHDMTKRLERIQYSAAVAVSRAWRGTNIDRLYEELGWESLYYRRWYRTLPFFQVHLESILNVFVSISTTLTTSQI